MRLCDNSCPAFFTNDGVCDDGGEGSRWNNCGALGTDCADCGERCRGFKGCTPAWMNSHKYVC